MSIWRWQVAKRNTLQGTTSRFIPGMFSQQMGRVLPLGLRKTLPSGTTSKGTTLCTGKTPGHLKPAQPTLSFSTPSLINGLCGKCFTHNGLLWRHGKKERPMEATTVLLDIPSRAECEAMRACPYDDEEEGMSNAADSFEEESIQGVATIHMMDATEEEGPLAKARTDLILSDQGPRSDQGSLEEREYYFPGPHPPSTPYKKTELEESIDSLHLKLRYCLDKF